MYVVPSLNRFVTFRHLPFCKAAREQVLVELLWVPFRGSFENHASERSLPHFSSGIAITATSATTGCSINVFSRSAELIHPDWTRSFVRSVMRMKPSRLTERDVTAAQPAVFSELVGRDRHVVVGARDGGPARMNLANVLPVPRLLAFVSP